MVLLNTRMHSVSITFLRKLRRFLKGIYTLTLYDQFVPGDIKIQYFGRGFPVLHTCNYEFWGIFWQMFRSGAEDF